MELVTFVRYAELRRLPRTAMPSAPPTSRVVSFTAEPTPALSSGSELMMAAVAGAIVLAIPEDMMTRDAAYWRYELSGPSSESDPRPIATSVRPRPMTLRRPKRWTSASLLGATMTMVAADGRMASPAWSGVNAFTSCRYWVEIKNVPNIARNTRKIAAAPTLNRGSAKKRIGSIG